MQQQMFEQFTQMMMAMGQMLREMQRDQAGLIREELSRLQQVSQELRELQAELAAREAIASTTRGAGLERQLSPPSSPGPAEDEHPLPAVSNGAQPGPDGAPARDREGESAPAGPPSPREAAERPKPQVTAEGPSDQDIHTRLYERIRQLQEERESRWRKLFNSLFGKSPEGPKALDPKR
jgi:hypothetical protein